MEATNIAPFLNREQEMRFLQSWVAEEPKNILFIYGPKSSGKTTLIYRFLQENLSSAEYDIKHFNLREIFLAQYQDFIRAFFEHDYSKEKGDVREKREYDLKVFKLTVEALKGLEAKELDPFVVMKKELVKLNGKGIRPVIVIDELQALEGVYMNGQREVLRELFNFFVAMTKESHLCHVIIASSDGYFIERIYNDSKLKKASEFLEVEYLTKSDVYQWLNNLAQKSRITKYTLTDEQIETIWETFGGSCWEISRFLGDIQMLAVDGSVPADAFAKVLDRKLIQARSMYVHYAGLYKHKRQLFRAINRVAKEKGRFREDDVTALVESGIYEVKALRDDLGELVGQNFISYNPVTAEFAVQGRSMELGLAMYVELIEKTELGRPVQ
ncbi:MAG: hypothetical protein A2075_04270 [Geobacteraceae bacterium GWC2_58_44]|nr:MAG: hypothetical protein A2075_04270 [Geobacteraceae bacterium GWC2_58_44]HBG06060.1 hypothetical protein [Geobacter sp.]